MFQDPTVIVIKWTVRDKQVIKLSLEIQEGGEGDWAPIAVATGMNIHKTEFKIQDLKAEVRYMFRLDMRRPGEDNPSYVESNLGRSVEAFFNYLFRLIST